MNGKKGHKNFSKEINDKKKIQKFNKYELIDENKELNSKNKFECKGNNNDMILKENKSINNDNCENKKLSERDEAINKFIYQMENKTKEKGENSELNNKEEEESNDPFLKAEKEYRKKNYQNEDIKSENNLKIKSKEYSENLRFNTEKEEYSNRNTNKRIKGKKLIEKILFRHFKNDINYNYKEKNKFKPKIFKNPQNLYFKAIDEMKLNYLKMKSYDRRTGIFDLKKYNEYKNYYIKKNKQNNHFFNSTKTSFNSVNKNKYSNIIKNDVKVLSYLDYFKSVNKKNKNKKKAIIDIDNDIISLNNKNVENINSDNKNIFYTSISTNIPTNETNNTINNKLNKAKTITSNFSEDRKVSISENKIKVNNNPNLIINSAKNKISSKKLRDYLLEHHKNQIKSKNSATFKSSRKNKNNKYFMKNLFYSIVDPKNPYSINFSRNLLKNNYHLDIHYDYNRIELGIPLLSIKEVKDRKFKKLSNFSENIVPKKRMAKTTYDSFYSRYKIFPPNKNKRMNNNRYAIQSGHY